MKRTRFILWVINLIVAINFLPSLIAVTFDKSKMAIPYGSIVKLQHVKTERYLAAGAAGKAVYAIDDEDDESTLWMLRATSDEGRNYDKDGPKFGISIPELITSYQLDYEAAAKAGIDKHTYFQRFHQSTYQNTAPARKVRLEHIKTKQDLCSSIQNIKITIPESQGNYAIALQAYDKNGKVSSNGHHQWPIHNNWMFTDLEPGTDGVLVDGIVGRLLASYGYFLYSKNGYFFNKEKDLQEVAQLSYHKTEFLEDTLFRIKLVSAPDQHNFRGLKELWQKMRGPKLQYNTLVWVGLTSTASQSHSTFGMRIYDTRLITFGWSPLVEDAEQAKEPNRHVSLKSYVYNLADKSAASSWFLLQNADNPADNGPVKYGDKLKIFSTAVGAWPSNYGTQWKEFQGILNPPKQWRIYQYPNAKEPKGEFTVVISDPNHEDFKKNDGICGIFTLEPAMPGIKKGEEIYQYDLLQIRSLGSVQHSKPRTLWSWSGAEVFASDNDDAYGLKKYHNHRDNLFHRFHVHHVVKKEIPDDAINDFNKITRSLKQWQEEAIERAKKEAEERAKREAEEKAKQEQKQPEAAAKEIVVFGGFDPLPGELTHIAAGLKHVKQGGAITHQLKAWGITKDNTLVEMQEGDNPWVVHPAKDDAGNALPPFKSIAIGFDGTTYAVTTGGEVYRYNWPNEPRPGKAKKKRKKKKKAKKKKKTKKRRKKKKVKQEKKLKGTIFKK